MFVMFLIQACYFGLGFQHFYPSELHFISWLLQTMSDGSPPKKFRKKINPPLPKQQTNNLPSYRVCITNTHLLHQLVFS